MNREPAMTPSSPRTRLVADAFVSTAVALALSLAACFPSLVLTSGDDAGAVDASLPPDANDVVDAAPPVDASDAGGDATSDASTVDGGSILTDCVLLLHMDETSWTGPGAVRDSSGHGNHGTFSAQGGAPAAGGKFGRGALLNGSTWITVPDSPSLHATTALTIALWMAPTGLTDGGASPGVISKRQGFQNNVAYTLFLWEGNHAWVDVGATRFPSSFVFPNGVFHHVAVVYDAAADDVSRRVRIYVDGSLDATSTAATAIASNVEDIIVGALPGGGDKFSGRIDEVALWTRALTEAEIASLAAATGPLP